MMYTFILNYKCLLSDPEDGTSFLNSGFLLWFWAFKQNLATKPIRDFMSIKSILFYCVYLDKSIYLHNLLFDHAEILTTQHARVYAAWLIAMEKLKQYPDSEEDKSFSRLSAKKPHGFQWLQSKYTQTELNCTQILKTNIKIDFHQIGCSPMNISPSTRNHW